MKEKIILTPGQTKILPEDEVSKSFAQTRKIRGIIRATSYQNNSEAVQRYRQQRLTQAKAELDAARAVFVFSTENT